MGRALCGHPAIGRTGVPKSGAKIKRVFLQMKDMKGPSKSYCLVALEKQWSKAGSSKKDGATQRSKVPGVASSQPPGGIPGREALAAGQGLSRFGGLKEGNHRNRIDFLGVIHVIP